jgi:DNA-binding XRE family transcriptional regulator
MLWRVEYGRKKANTMAKSFDKLRRKMPRARQASARARTDVMIGQLALAELRRKLGVTQQQLAEVLDIQQAAVSRIERRDDVLLSSLAAYVQALGGELEVAARFGDRQLRLSVAGDSPEQERDRSKRALRAA